MYIRGGRKKESSRRSGSLKGDQDGERLNVDYFLTCLSSFPIPLTISSSSLHLSSSAPVQDSNYPFPSRPGAHTPRPFHITGSTPELPSPPTSQVGESREKSLSFHKKGVNSQSLIISTWVKDEGHSVHMSLVFSLPLLPGQELCPKGGKRARGNVGKNLFTFSRAYFLPS
ncbi:unnamed protein product [Allacma fusca]|uniref:Uncharacterized protein n=1 Tax=Allacma fusca TaxID=39272 RepID=A0A8J2JYZ4_9HEXA|nr:unnamed protein product [Allacma fusca]